MRTLSYYIFLGLSYAFLLSVVLGATGCANVRMGFAPWNMHKPDIIRDMCDDICVAEIERAHYESLVRRATR
jgi:hypothetical protein